MKTKIITVSALIIVSAMLTLFGCGKKTDEPKVQPETKQEGTAPATETVAKALTDDDFIEYWAQMTYIGEKFEKDPMRYGEEIQKVYKKIGLTEKEGEVFGERYAEWMANWQKKMMADPEKAGKEWDAIGKKVENRVAELKAGK